MMNGISWFWVIFFLVVYFVPTIMARHRRSRAREGILVLNLFLGWTALGWLIALIWAVSGITDAEWERMHPTSAIIQPPVQKS